MAGICRNMITVRGKVSVFISTLSANRLSWPVGARVMSKTAPIITQPVGKETPKSNLKPFSEIPRPKGLPFVGTMFQFPKDPTKFTQFFRDRCDEYFPIYVEDVLGTLTLVIYDVNDIEKLIRAESKYPQRTDIPSWSHHREVSGKPKGLFISQGEEWHRMRRVVDKPMLRIKEVATYTDSVNEVLNDFIKRLDHIKDTDGLVPDLERELFHWSLESIGKIVYERRFGGLSGHRDPEMQNFIDSIREMNRTSAKFLPFPMKLCKVIFPKDYRVFMESWDTLFRVGKKCIDQRMSEVSEISQEGDEPIGVLAYLALQSTLTVQEVYANVSELMIGAVDTTSSTVLWCLYELARNPDVQEKILAEVKAIFPENGDPTYRDVQNLHYTKAVIKETLRMYPVAIGFVRIPDQDFELSGYHIPANTPVSVQSHVLNRLPYYYDDPDTFRPERWLRNTGQKISPFIQLQFGYGTRMCIGRRVAELEMYLLITRLVKRYRIEPGFLEPIIPTMLLILKPSQPLKIKLKERT